MSKKKILELEIKILIAKYGEKAVYAEINKSLSHIQSENKSTSPIPPRASTSTTTKKINQEKYIKTIIQNNPHIAPEIEYLHKQFIDGLFLPQTKDARIFVEKRTGAPTNLRSRDDSIKKIFDILSTLPKDELNQLISKSNEKEISSSLGIISDEIMNS